MNNQFAFTHNASTYFRGVTKCKILLIVKLQFLILDTFAFINYPSKLPLKVAYIANKQSLYKL